METMRFGQNPGVLSIVFCEIFALSKVAYPEAVQIMHKANLGMRFSSKARTAQLARKRFQQRLYLFPSSENFLKNGTEIRYNSYGRSYRTVHRTVYTPQHYAQPHYAQPHYAQPQYSQPQPQPLQPLQPQGGIAGQVAPPNQIPQAPSQLAPGRTARLNTASVNQAPQPRQTVQRQPVQQQPAQQQTTTPAPAGNSNDSSEASALQMLASLSSSQPAAADQNTTTQIPQFTPAASTSAATPHVGTWKVNLPGNQSVELVLDESNGFRWTATRDGKSNSFQGQFRLENGRLTLVRSNDLQQMTGSWTGQGEKFTFKLDGATTGGLAFVRS